jgi:hypothetical protein
MLAAVLCLRALSVQAPVRCLSCNGNILLSGCQGGVLKLWRLSDGQLADSCSLPDKSSVTCITCLGPLLVSNAAAVAAAALGPMMHARGAAYAAVAER